jgi:hypothetical protein
MEKNGELTAQKLRYQKMGQSNKREQEYQLQLRLIVE